MIPKIRNILYATDLSRNSAYAFRYAINSAQKHDAQVHILHVVERMSPSTEALVSTYLSDENMKKLREGKKQAQVNELKRRLKDFAESELKDNPEELKRVASIVVTEGDPAAEILDKVDSLNCDIVIMGSHGKGLIAHAFLGSVSEKVLRQIYKPIFIIPIPKK
jgi:nucleotide-binding universal stress UspA family protein